MLDTEKQSVVCVIIFLKFSMKWIDFCFAYSSSSEVSPSQTVLQVLEPYTVDKRRGIYSSAEEKQLVRISYDNT